MPQEITFPQWLRARRKALDLTQPALAELVNCSSEMIYRIEAGQRRPSVQVARLMAKALNVPDAEVDAFVMFARAHGSGDQFGVRPATAPWQEAFLPKHNLPLQLTSLIGREQHLTDAINRLRKDEVRLMTLVGPPGIGKTRLAIQLGRDSLLDFPDGVFLVELAAITQAQQIVFAIASALGIFLTDHKKPADSLHNYLYRRHVLLLLDNFEQLLDAAPAVHALLIGCPLVKAVVTSRAPLRIRGERLFPVAPLALPGRAEDVNVRGLARFAAIRLFVERAEAVSPNFELTPGNAPVVASICARLDGLPLAIEIAAAQMMTLQPEEILGHLAGKSLLQIPGMIDSDRRHHSLNEAINWSYHLLSDPEKTFFRRLGVFVDGATLESAGVVCQSEVDIVLALSKLVGISLVRREIHGSNSSRYRLLEVIREFAQHELQVWSEWQATRARHAAFFLAYVLEHEPNVRGNGQVAGLEMVRREHRNIQAALDYFIENGSWHEALRMVGALAEFWVYHNHVLIGLGYASAVLSATAGDPLLAAGRARVLNGAAMMSYFAGDFAAIGIYAEEALSTARTVCSVQDIAWACISLGMLNGGMGNYGQAIEYFNQGIEVIGPPDLPWEHASLLNGLGEVARSQARFEEALSYFGRAIEISEEMGCRWLAAHVLDNIGHTAYSQQRYGMASEYVRRSLDASTALGDDRGIAMCLEKLGGIAIAQKQSEFGARLLGAAQALREATNAPIEGMDAADYRRFVEQLQKQLPAPDLEAAWDSGRRLSVPELLDQLSAHHRSDAT